MRSKRQKSEDLGAGSESFLGGRWRNGSGDAGIAFNCAFVQGESSVVTRGVVELDQICIGIERDFLVRIFFVLIVLWATPASREDQ